MVPVLNPRLARDVAFPAQRSHKTGATPSSFTASGAPHFKQFGIIYKDNSPDLILSWDFFAAGAA
jgi:hypothetical protein